MSEEVLTFANNILTEIGQPSLTEVEQAGLPASLEDESLVYQFLAGVINARAFPDDGIKKLNAYALLQGVDYSGEAKRTNNIVIGCVIEE